MAVAAIAVGDNSYKTLGMCRPLPIISFLCSSDHMEAVTTLQTSDRRSDHMEAVTTLQTSDRRWLKHAKPSKRVSNRTYHCSLYSKPSNGGADHLFADPTSANPYSLPFSDLINPYAQQPPRPLLPLSSKPCNVMALSYPPNNSKITKRPNNKSSSSLTTSTSVTLPLTLKKSSPKPKHHPKIDQKMNPKGTAVSATAPVVGSNKGNPTNLHSGKQEADGMDVELSCPFVYSLAPPPSSLPLPSFALRPKLGCNVTAAAAGVSAQLLHPPSMKTNE